MDWQVESGWQTVVAAALVGTERQPFTPPPAPGKLGQVLAALTSRSPEAALLSAAAVLVLHRQAGQRPEPVSGTLPSPCSLEDLPRCSARAARFLQQILQGQYAQLLPEWIAIATRLQQRVPEIYLSLLLDRGQQQRHLRPSILSVLGQRGRWLAAQNPDWSYAVAVTPETDWDTGSQAARLLFLQDLRAEDAAQARDLLATTWSREPAADRAKFLATFDIGLGLADQPFLEQALGDRSKEVRRIAAHLLASLPASRLGQSMAERVRPYLACHAGKPPILTVQLPEALDPALIQDGLEPKPSQSAADKVGEKAWWLLQLIGATPLDVWTTAWGLSPVAIVQCACHHAWETVLLDGWALAAQRQRNIDWIQALLGVWQAETGGPRSSVLPDVSLETLLQPLPAEQRNAFWVDSLKSGRSLLNDTLTLRLLRSHTAWNLALATTVLDRLAADLGQNPATPSLIWELRTALKEFAQFLPLDCLSRAAQLKDALSPDSPWRAEVEAFLALLHFRQEMAQSFERTDSG